MQLDLLRSKAALWAGAGALAMAGAATTFAASGALTEPPETNEPPAGFISAVQPQIEPGVWTACKKLVDRHSWRGHAWPELRSGSGAMRALRAAS